MPRPAACRDEDCGSGSCPEPTLLYHRLMLPNWLRNHAQWSCENEGDDLRLVIKEDSADWENILRVQLLPCDFVSTCADITVNMVVGVMTYDCDTKYDSMSFMLSDCDFAMGFQVVDSSDDHCKCGPLRAVEGESGNTLRNPNANVAVTPGTPCKNGRLGEFTMSCKPGNAWGKASCAVDDGVKVVAQYSDCLDMNKGLKFELYRYKCSDRYTLNYVEITVYEDSPVICSKYSGSSSSHDHDHDRDRDRDHGHC